MQMELECQVLKVLEVNLCNYQPQVVNTAEIASELNLGFGEAINLIKVLHQNGKVICNDDGTLSIITLSGLEWLKSKSEQQKN